MVTIQEIVDKNVNNGKSIGMCQMNLATIEAQSWVINHMEELFQLIKDLKYDHMGRLIKDILGEGLLEIKSRAAQIEEHERSEKDCLW